MASVQKRLAQFSRKVQSKPAPKKPNRKREAKAPRETPTGERYSFYRTLKVCQLLMKAMDKFLSQFKPFMSDEIGIAAGNLHAEVRTQLQVINAIAFRCENLPSGTPRSAPWEGGDA